MVETELKFRVPPERRDALHRAVATAGVSRTRLQAIYFDTPQRHLAQAGMALRLRKEGRRWVQTLKGRVGLMARSEHEVPLPLQRGEPVLDLQRHADTPVGQALAEVLAQAGLSAADLRVLYRTDVMRLHRLLRQPGASFELAYDRGHLLAGAGAALRKYPVDELELELKSGPPQALATLAQRWVARFGLWWDPRSKSEMGVRLALAQTAVPATKAQAPDWPANPAPAAVFAGALQASLVQALANAAELADGRGGAEHLHQLRVGLRRLRAVLRAFAAWSPDPAAALALEADWRAPFRTFGSARDADVLAQGLGPRLAAAGAPAFDWPAPAHAPDIAATVRSAEVQGLLLRTLALSLAPGGATAALAPAARELLRPAWRALRRDASAFADADTPARHRLRKRLKRLRYALEFLQPLYPPKAMRGLLRRVAAALQALGELNDIDMALAALKPHTEAQPQAWFAIGWLTAGHEVVLAQAASALAQLDAAPRPWRRG